MTMPADQTQIEVPFTLNGSEIVVRVEPSERLLDTLRYHLAMTGTKEGCGEGECGACTVNMNGLPVNSCLVPTYQARGAEIETIESVQHGSVHPLHSTGATQCGACTPGVVMSAMWLLKNRDKLDTHTVRELMAGNLCRCTGYDGIVNGVESALGLGSDE